MTIHWIALRSRVACLAAAAAAPLAAQTPSNQPEIVACYDSRTSSTGTPQGTGIVYRIKVPGVVAQAGCVDPRHTQFSWTIRHSALSGLGNDDHPQYLLANGARVVTQGFAVTGGYPTFATIPATGAGTRFMWFAGKAALRAGHIDESHAALWDDGAIGVASTALGFNSNASAAFAFACCAEATATNQFAMVLGSNSTASGWAATAIGNSATASGDYSTAIGFQAHTNLMAGSTVIADAQGGPPVKAMAPNSFVVRALRVWFGKSGDQVATEGHYLETSTGAYLSDGGAWTNSSSRALKDDFRAEDGESVLARIANLPVRSWHYRAEGSSVRHIGPTAEDFRAAFGLGDTDAAIATVDIDGVNLLAVQALERRTAALQAENADLKRRVARLESLLRRVPPPSRKD